LELLLPILEIIHGFGESPSDNHQAVQKEVSPDILGQFHIDDLSRWSERPELYGDRIKPTVPSKAFLPSFHCVGSINNKISYISFGY
jgi:hypothetical protein